MDKTLEFRDGGLLSRLQPAVRKWFANSALATAVATGRSLTLPSFSLHGCNRAFASSAFSLKVATSLQLAVTGRWGS